MSGKFKIEPFNAVLWANWEQRFLEEEEQAYRELEPGEPVVPQHDRMTSKEVMTELRWSMSTLRRRVSSRKLAYFREDGKMFFRRADVDRYKQKRYVREK